MEEVQNATRIFWGAVIRPTEEMEMKDSPLLLFVSLGDEELSEGVVFTGFFIHVLYSKSAILFALENTTRRKETFLIFSATLPFLNLANSERI